MTSSLTSCKFVALLVTACTSFVSAQNTTQAPNSTPTPCPNLANPENGAVITTATSAVYSCVAGFQFSNGEMEVTRMCQDGTWNGTEPVCVQIPTTPAPPAMMSSSAAPMEGDASTTGSAQGSSAAPTTAGQAGMDSTKAPGMESTAAAMATKGDHDMDHEDNDGNGGGLNNSQIALAVLATLLIVGAIAFFSGLLYWKYRGTSYVEVSANY